MVISNTIKACMLTIAIAQPIATYTVPDWLKQTSQHMKDMATAPVTIISATVGSMGYIAYKWRMHKERQESRQGVAFGWGKDAHNYNTAKLHQHKDKITIAEKQLYPVPIKETKPTENSIFSRIYYTLFPRPYARIYTQAECQASYDYLNGARGYSSMAYKETIEKIKTEDSWDAIRAEARAKIEKNENIAENLPYTEGFGYLQTLPDAYSASNITDGQKTLRARFYQKQKDEYQLIQHLKQNHKFSDVDALELKRIYKEYDETHNTPINGDLMKNSISSIKIELNNKHTENLLQQNNKSLMFTDMPLDDCLAYISQEIQKLEDPEKSGTLSNAIKQTSLTNPESCLRSIRKHDALYYLRAQYKAKKDLEDWYSKRGMPEKEFWRLINIREPIKSAAAGSEHPTGLSADE